MSDMDHALENRISHIPGATGVYLMKDRDGGVLYVGKAKNLRARVRSYFARTDARFMVPFLLSRVHDVAFIVTETEKEALILENTLIKENRPRYNVDFRDDKAYFHIRIDPADAFPRFQLIRRPKKDGAKYFGPYPSSAAAKETLRFLQPLFPLRTCRDRELRSRSRPCLEYEIGRCLAPCVKRVEEEAYRRVAAEATAFLEGREKSLLAGLRLRMNGEAEQLNFEQAAALRDRIAAIEATLERQRMVSLSARDQDVYGLHREKDRTQVCALFVRGGRIVGQKSFPVLKVGGDTPSILSSLLKQYYDGGAYLPDEIMIPHPLEDQAVMAEWLTERKGKRVAIAVNRRGQGRALLEMARRNAENVFKTERLRTEDPEEALPALAEKLSLKRLPRRIECFDISNLGGRHAVGSMVVFLAGKPLKSGYRRFRIGTVAGADDYGMMREVLSRRYGRREDLPDLIVVDGGKGQLGVALSVLKDLGIAGVDAIGLAKEQAGEFPPAFGRKRESASGGTGLEKGRDRVYLPGRRDPIYLHRWPPVRFLLARIRDEAHRFAVSYHRSVRERQDLRSLLDDIPGVGPAKKRALLTAFGDLDGIRVASAFELRKAPGIGAVLAGQIHDFLKRRKR
jgi:excinuclease ABC subunit C